MFMLAGRLALALLLAALCLAGGTAHAQSAAVNYWTPGWPLGFGGSLSAAQSANAQGSNAQGLNTYGNFPSFEGTDARGFDVSRFNFPNGFFVGSERGNLGFSQNAAFGSLTSEGMQFGYNLKNAPVTFFGGIDTLKYNSGIGTPLAPFGSVSGTAGYSAHAGVEFKPASNLSVSLGFGYTQTGGRLDSDTASPSLSNASPFDLVGGRH
jgi:opacity protein-like surface antigen